MAEPIEARKTSPTDWDFAATPTPALHEDLNEQVNQLAQFYANTDGDEAWRREMKRV